MMSDRFQRHVKKRGGFLYRCGKCHRIFGLNKQLSQFICPYCQQLQYLGEIFE